MSNVTSLNTPTTVLHDFFVACIGTGDSRNLMDVIITDSLVKKLKANPDGRGAKTIDRVEAKDVNYVFDNGTYRTFRIVAKNWDKTISILKRFAAGTNKETDEDPRQELLLADINGQFYQQQVVMQDLGLDFPVSVLLAEENNFPDLNDGDIAALELQFEKAGSLLSAAFKQTKSNLLILGNDKDVKRDHIMHYTTFIDFDKRTVAASLNKFDYKLDGDKEKDFNMTPKELDVEEFKDIFTSDMGRSALLRLSTIFTSYNNYVVDKFAKHKHSDSSNYIIDMLFKGVWGNVMKSSDLVYSLDKAALTTEIEEACEKVLTIVADLGPNVKMDLNSLKAYDWSDTTNPVFVKDISPELHEVYRQEFVGMIMSSLLYTQHDSLKPYGIKKVITDEADIAAIPVGSVRASTF